ncbi:MAG: hypothetical protein QXL91_04360 [Candidatus Bathyarchaeia archaeon]
MSSDSSALMDRLDSIENRFRRIDEEVAKGKEVIVIDEAHLRSKRDAVSSFLVLSESLKGKWKGSLSSVEEVRKMRKHSRGY